VKDWKIEFFIQISLLERLKKYADVRNLSVCFVVRVLAMVKDIEVHHLPSLKDLRLHATSKYTGKNCSPSQNMSF